MPVCTLFKNSWLSSKLRYFGCFCKVLDFLIQWAGLMSMYFFLFVTYLKNDFIAATFLLLEHSLLFLTSSQYSRKAYISSSEIDFKNSISKLPIGISTIFETS